MSTRKVHNHTQSHLIPIVKQEVYERQQIHATKAAQQTDMQMVELKAELKQRAFELSHLKVRPQIVLMGVSSVC